MNRHQKIAPNMWIKHDKTRWAMDHLLTCRRLDPWDPCFQPAGESDSALGEPWMDFSNGNSHLKIHISVYDICIFIKCVYIYIHISIVYIYIYIYYIYIYQDHPFDQVDTSTHRHIDTSSVFSSHVPTRASSESLY